MNLHEYQAKQLLGEYQLPVPKGGVIRKLSETLDLTETLGLKKWVVKAQVHAGGRGKAGGVKIVSTKEDLSTAVKSLLGTRLVTYQTDAHGQPVDKVLIEQPCNIDRELYLGAVLDRSKQRVIFMASTEGGVEIEKIAEEHPEKILKAVMDPLVGMMPYQARELGFALGLDLNQIKQFTNLLVGL